jgi:hypothetical protein
MFKRNPLLMVDDPGAAGGGAAAAAGGAGAGAGAGGQTGASAGAADAGAKAGAASGAADAGGQGAAAAGAEGGAGAAAKEPPKADWAEDWRTKLAGEKPDKQLERMASPKDVYNSWKALQSKLSSGELKSTLPKDAKPEDVAKWRTENGIPEKHTDYKMPDGVVVGDADKPLIDLFLQDMHGKNASPEMVQTAVASYYKIQEQQAAAIAEADVSHKDEMENTLRAEWGAEYRGNVNAITSMLSTAPGGIKDKILSARMADGRAIMNDPDVLRWFATTSRELNPVATVVPSGGDQMGAITDELAGIEKLMGNRSSEYWKGPKADAMQARYRTLVAARDRKTK